MKLKIIGSGDMKSIYNSASYLIDDDILIDIPNGTNKALIKENLLPSDINNLLITHYHGDHFFDIPFLLLSKLDNCNNKINIYTHKSGFKKIKNAVKLAFPNTVKKIYNGVEINKINDETFKINDYEINRVKVQHSSLKNSFGYTFKKDNLVVSFTGDARYSEEIENMAKISNYLVCDCTSITGNHRHMGIDDILKLDAKYPKCKYIVSHMNDLTRKELMKLKHPNIVIAKDYDDIILK